MSALRSIVEQDEKKPDLETEEEQIDKRLQELITENKLLKEKLFCTVCKSAHANKLITPCYHRCICLDCFPSQTRCPRCNSKIDSGVTVYNS